MPQLFILFVKLLFSTFEGIAVFVFSLSLFRLPVKTDVWKIYLFPLLMAVISVFQEQFLHMNQNVIALTNLIIFIVIFTLLFNIRFYFSVLICFIGYLGYFIIQTVLVLSAIFLHITTNQLIEHSLLHGSALQLASVLVALFLSRWMQRKKIGFMFIHSRITPDPTINQYNIYIAGIIILGMLTTQIDLISFRKNAPFIYIFSFILLLFMLGLIFTYRKNKRELQQKYRSIK
ncbi:MAG: hypothetical protein A2189_07880 [Paenibacillus sp. RIFOXYA1_FULL_44_5]|nr:MAG: hypothetical protein A2189_07880 [Paenibacillus sp. RIFOXYA1_FULL_44_5]